MWRRRRDAAQRGAKRPDTTGGRAWGSRSLAVLGLRRSGTGRRAWRMDQSGSAQVALQTPPEFARQTAATGLAPAPVAYPTNGRLGDLMPSVYCTGCGEANPEGARFCSQCGTPLVRRSGDRAADTTSTISIGGGEFDDVGDDSGADSAAVAALPPGTALLAVRRGPNAGSQFLLDSDLTLVGRHPDSDIFLDDVTVSRRHAEFYRLPGGRFTVRDVGSLNGTYVNRERIEEAQLNEGDEVQVGKFRLVFLLGPGTRPEFGGGSQVGG
jgi:FHA domain/zinc-ribbon domain